MKLKLVTLSSLLCTAATASVTLVGEVGALRNSSGVEVAPGAVAVIIADFSNNGIGDLFNTVLAANSFVGGGTDDKILHVGAISAVNGFSSYSFSATFEYGGLFGPNDNLYVAWFPSINLIGSTVGGAVSYGLYRTSLIDTNSGSEIGWVAPPDGGAYNIAAYDNTIAPGAIATPAALTANLVTAGAPIPEPSAAAVLGGLIALGAVATRRRRAA